MSQEFPHREYDPKAHPDSNAQHMRYMLEGYRAFVVEGQEDCPYSPGSPRGDSWKKGFEQAQTDTVKIEATKTKTVFIITLRHGSTLVQVPPENLGVYGSEELAKGRLDKLRKEWLEKNSGFRIQEHESGRGFIVYHVMGTMSFVPASFGYEEHPVLSA